MFLTVQFRTILKIVIGNEIVCDVDSIRDFKYSYILDILSIFTRTLN